MCNWVLLPMWIAAGPTAGSMIKFNFGSVRWIARDLDGDGTTDIDDIVLLLEAIE